MKAGDRYLKIVEWSEEDRCYVGSCPGLMFGGIHGDDEAKVYRELCQAVEEWIAVCQRDGDTLPAATAGKKYSGKFVVRVGEELHKTLAIDALRYGESLNTYCVQLLRETQDDCYGKGGRDRRKPSIRRRANGDGRLSRE